MLQPNAFVTYFERDETAEGAKHSHVRFYLRTLENPYGRSLITAPQGIRHRVVTGMISRERIQQFETAMKAAQQDFQKYGIRFLPPFSLGNKYVIYHADCPHLEQRVMQQTFPKDFITNGRNSISRMIAWNTGFPFQLVHYDEKTGKLDFTGGTVSAEHLANEKKAAVDIETKNWERVALEESILAMPDEKLKDYFKQLLDVHEIPFDFRTTDYWKRKHYVKAIEDVVQQIRKEDITIAAYATLDRRNIIFTTLDAGVAKLQVRIPGTKDHIDFEIVRLADSKEIVRALTETYQDDDPLWSIGHYQLKFDYDKLNSILGEDLFLPGVGKTKPHLAAQAGGGFIVRREIPGRLDFDGAMNSMHYSWTPDNKLDTWFNYSTGSREKKDITHAELPIVTKQAESGDKDAARLLIGYAATDPLKSLRALNAKEQALLAKHYRSLPSRVNTTSKRTLSEQNDDRQHLSRVKTFPKSLPSLEQKIWDNFNVHELKYDLIDRRLPTDERWLKTKRGSFDAVLVYITPFAHALEDVIRMKPDSAAVLDYVASSSDQKSKIRVMQAIDADTERLIFELRKITNTDFKTRIDSVDSNTDFKFRARFGLLDKQTAVSLHNVAVDSADVLFDALKGYVVINRSDKFLVLHDEPGLEARLKGLEQDRLAIPLCTARVLSGQNGSFIAYDGNFIIAQGFDPSGKKGERYPFETLHYEQFIKHALVEDNPYNALMFVDKKARQLAQGDIPAKELTLERVAKRGWTDYSSNATIGLKAHLIKEQIEAGDMILRSDTIPNLQKKFYGDDEQMGTIRNLVLLRFPLLRGKAAQALERIFAGTSTGDDISLVMKESGNKIRKATERQLALF